MRHPTVLVVILATAACGPGHGAEGRGLSGGGAGTATVRVGPAEDVFLMTGETAAVRSLDLTPPPSDAWELQIKWLAENGAEVRAGDRVVEFDNTAVVQSLEERRLKAVQTRLERENKEGSLASEAERKRATREKAAVEAEKARLDAAVPVELRARAEWYKMQIALREKETAHQKAIDDERSFQASTKADIQALKIAEEKAARDLAAAENTLSLLSLKTPRDGIFIVASHFNEDRPFQQGDTIFPGLKIASIPDLREMKVVASLPEVDHGRLKAGLPARCILDTYPDETFDGQIEKVSGIAEAPARGRGASQSGFKVQLSLAKTDPARMRPGMSVRVEVVRQRWERALLLPRGAVIREGDASFVRRGGSSTRVPVRLAACLAVDCVVESGLKEGDHVALP